MTRTDIGLPIGSFSGALKPTDTLKFLEKAHSLGAGGIQAPLSSLDPAYVRLVRERAESLGMWIELCASMPHPDAGAFELALRAAKEVGALCVRTACIGGYLMPGIVNGRRYEVFKTIEQWRDFNAVARKAIERAVAAGEAARMPVAMENHKDWTTEEIEPIFREFSGRYFGCCLDTGNNLSLLDSSSETVTALARYAVTAHVKDLRLQLTPLGFEMAEVELGTGVLDVWAAIRTIRKARPEAKVHVEVIARNPLSIPCLTEGYWVSFQDRGGQRLASMLGTASRSKGDLSRADGRTAEDLLKWEDEMVSKSLSFLSSESAA